MCGVSKDQGTQRILVGGMNRLQKQLKKKVKEKRLWLKKKARKVVAAAKEKKNRDIVDKIVNENVGISCIGGESGNLKIALNDKMQL